MISKSVVYHSTTIGTASTRGEVVALVAKHCDTNLSSARMIVETYCVEGPHAFTVIAPAMLDELLRDIRRARGEAA